MSLWCRFDDGHGLAPRRRVVRERRVPAERSQAACAAFVVHAAEQVGRRRARASSSGWACISVRSTPVRARTPARWRRRSSSRGSRRRGDRDGRSARTCVRGRSVVGRSAEVEDSAAGRQQEVAAAVRCRCHADDRLGQVRVADRTVETRVAEAEDAAVARDEPVAVPAGRGRPADDRLVEVDRAGGPEEPRVAEAEDAAVTRR